MSAETMMAVDTAEEEWLLLHDVKLNGPMLEYTGLGKGVVDVGLAQAKTPIGTRNHYFEIEIVNPGNSCYIAIGELVVVKFSSSSEFCKVAVEHDG